MQIFMVPIHALRIWENFLISAGEQEVSNPVPILVESSLYNSFTGFQNVEWKKNHHYYKADFELRNVIFSALFSLDGRLLMQKHEISEEELPEVIRLKVHKDYGNYKVKKVEKIEQDKTVYFCVRLQDSLGERLDIFSADGESNQTIDL